MSQFTPVDVANGQIPFAFVPLDELPAIASDVCQCHNCGTEVIERDGVELDGETHCPDCVCSCENCNHVALIDDDEIQQAYTSEYRSSRNRTEMLCSDCRFECADCNEQFSTDIEHYDNASDERICGSCRENYYSCDECGCTIHADDTHYDRHDNCLCSSCYREAKSALVRPYSYKPSPNFHRADTEQNRTGMPFYGIEIETEAEDYSGEMDEAIESADFDQSLFYFKEDSSIQEGFEIVSHPATYAYWQSNDMGSFESLRDDGFRSYNTGTCGMHVHVSRSALSGLDIFKLLAFVRNNAAFVAYVSRRKRTNLDHWARIDESPLHCLSKKAKGGSYGRYEALNLEPSHTVEFRIFRGTLNADGIKRNLAFVHALVSYVKTAGIRQLQVWDFVRWLESDGAQIIGTKEAASLVEWFNAYSANAPQNEGE